MKKVLDATISELWAQTNRKFTFSDMAYFFHWWSNRDETVRRMVYQLIRQGRLSFVGGGWSMSDEATTSYHAIIDHFTYSLRKINSTFLSCGRPLVAWQADVMGHSKEFASLMAQMGFDGLFVSPISYDDELARMRRNGLEFVWRGNDDLGQDTDIYTHKLFDGYWSPPGFCFGSLCTDPLLITSSQVFSNMEERAQEFVKLVKYRQAPYYTTQNIMVVMGRRGGYYDAAMWYANIDTLMSYINRKFDDLLLVYSNPACYLKAVYEANPQLQTKQDDFFPFGYDKYSYVTGMYTSRPTLKYMAREGHRYLQIAKQLQVTARLGNNDKLFEEFNWINGVFQDHNIITGEVRPHVVSYYVARMTKATNRIINTVMRYGLNKLRKNQFDTVMVRCYFNMSRCHSTDGPHMFIVVYNPLAWPVTMPVRLPMRLRNQVVYDPQGNKIPSGLMEIPDNVWYMKERNNTSESFELVFIAEDLPPMGFRSYFLRTHESGWIRPKRGLIKKINNKSKKYLARQPRSNLSDIDPLFNDLDMEYEYFEDEMTDKDAKNVTGDARRTGLNITEVTPKSRVSFVTTTPADLEMSTNEDTNVKARTTETTTIIEKEKTTTKDNTKDTDRTTTKDINKNRDGTTTKEITKQKDKTTEAIKTLSEGRTATKNRTLPKKNYTNKASTLDLNTTANPYHFKAVDDYMILSDNVPETTTDREKQEEIEDINESYWKGHASTKVKHTYIRNRYMRVNMDKSNKIVNIYVFGGIKIQFNVEMLYYVADDPSLVKGDRSAWRPPGAYIFRTMDFKPEPINDDYRLTVFKNRVVQEFHCRFSSWASVSLRLYKSNPVLEVDWLVGPVPLSDGLGKEVMIKYKTDLNNKAEFYTDSNGRQTLKRIRNFRPMFALVNRDPIAGNLYPVTSKIYIEDLEKNIRFAVLNDRAQAASSLVDGEINFLLHRRMFTEDNGIQAILNETFDGEGITVRGLHYIYITKADYKPHRVFEKKLAKEIELKPQIFASPSWGYGRYGTKTKLLWLKQNNEYSALKSKLPVGVHVLTLQEWNEGTLLLRLENYLEKSDAVRTGIKKVLLKDLFAFITITNVKETTLDGNMWLKDSVHLNWSKDKFLKSYNDAFGSGNYSYVEEHSRILEEASVDVPLELQPQQIRTFVIWYTFIE